VSGNDTSRVFQISSGVAVSIDDLTVTHGRGLLRGGGILNAGTLTLSHAVVSDNVVVGLPGTGPAVDAFGGGIFNTGTLTVSDSVFLHNRAIGGFGGGFPGAVAAGGAIANIALFGDANLSVSHSTLIDNRAMGGAPGTGSTAQIAKGGGIANSIAGVATPPVN